MSKKTFIDDILARRDERIQEKTTRDKLTDYSTTGRLRPWAAHKRMIYPLAKSYERLGMADIADRMLNCGQWLLFKECEDPTCGFKRIKKANYCRGRLCSMCQWRRSYRVAVDVRKVCHEAYLRYLEKGGKLRWILLTLTVRNARDHKELGESLKAMAKGWQRLMQRKRVKTAVVGSFRAVEVTVNSEKFRKYTKGKRKGQFIRDKKGNLIPNEWYGSYHPHIHALIAVKSSYFTKHYIKQKDWLELWKSACRLDYDPVVDVRPIKGMRDDDWEKKLRQELADLGEVEQEQHLQMKRLDGAIAETAKYSTKATDIVTPNDEETDRRVWELHTAFRGKRFMSYTGLLRECWVDLRKQGRVEDVESETADLNHMGDDPEPCNCPACSSELVEVVYGFFAKDGEYYKLHKRHTPEIEAEMDAEKNWKKDKS